MLLPRTINLSLLHEATWRAVSPSSVFTEMSAPFSSNSLIMSSFFDHMIAAKSTDCPDSPRAFTLVPSSRSSFAISTLRCKTARWSKVFPFLVCTERLASLSISIFAAASFSSHIAMHNGVYSPSSVFNFHVRSFIQEQFDRCLVVIPCCPVQCRLSLRCHGLNLSRLLF